MSRLLQIREEDLTELERLIPLIADQRATEEMRDTPRMRTMIRRVKEILSDVRWDYGPHQDIETIPAE